MMKHPPIMSPEHPLSKAAHGLAALMLALAMAGCSTIKHVDPPGGNENEESPPVARTSTMSSGSSSMDANRNEPAEVAQPQPVRMESAEIIPLAPGAPQQHIVQAGDTIWDIATTFLQDPWYWPEVWYIPPQIENPQLIYPGDILALIVIDGRRRITNVRASAYRLSPQANVTPLGKSITSIPHEQISAFLSKGFVLEKRQAERLPYILSTSGNHLAAAAGNDVYIRGGDPVPNGTRYSVVHVGDELRDPDNNNLLGYQGIYIGEGTLSRGGDPATVSLTDTNREALNGDLLIPETLDILLNFFPKMPDFDVAGQIISVIDGVSMVGQYQVVVLNRGARNGLAPGDVLSVFQTGCEVEDNNEGGSLNKITGCEPGRRLDEEAGTVMIFKVYDRIGYALVMEATSDIHVLDSVRNPG